VRQSRGRYTDKRPFVRCLEESWAPKTEREGKEWGSLAAAERVEGGAQAIRSAARRLLYVQYRAIGGRQASPERTDVGVE